MTRGIGHSPLTHLVEGYPVCPFGHVVVCGSMWSEAPTRIHCASILLVYPASLCVSGASMIGWSCFITHLVSLHILFHLVSSCFIWFHYTCIIIICGIKQLLPSSGLYVYSFIYRYVYLHIYIYIYIYVCAYVYIQVHIYKYIQAKYLEESVPTRHGPPHLAK